MPSLTVPARVAVAPAESARPVRRSGEAWLGLAGVLVFAALAAAPLAFGAVEAWAWASLAVLAALGLVAWAAANAGRRQLSLFWSPLYLPGILLLLAGTLQLVSGATLDPLGTREALLKLSTYLVLFFLASQLGARASEQRWRELGLLSTALAFGLAVFSILQFSSSQGLIYWSVKTDGWVFGPYVNHNHYAGLMEMLVPLTLAYVLSRPANSPARVLLGFAVSIPIVSLLLSGSRGGMLSLLAEALILGAVLGRSGALPGWRKFSRAGPLVLLAALLLFFGLDPGEVSGRLATVVRLARSSDVSLAERQAVAVDALGMLRHRAWVGAGLGSFAAAYPQYQSFPSDFVWDHAHNDYVEALVEGGLGVGALMAAALAMFFRLAFGGVAKRLESEAGQMQLGAALGCCGLLVHSAFDFNLHIPANAAWFAVCAALATLAPQTRRERLGLILHPRGSGYA